MNSYSGTTGELHGKDILYILPFRKEDLYYIYPFLGVSADDYRDKYCECSQCKQLKHVMFEQSELGNFEIVKPYKGSIRSLIIKNSIVIKDETESIIITFFDRKVSKIEAENTSILFTDENNLFEIQVRDIIFNKVPEHVCNYIIP